MLPFLSSVKLFEEIGIKGFTSQSPKVLESQLFPGTIFDYAWVFVMVTPF